MHKSLAEMKEERIASIEDTLTQLEQRDHAQTGGTMRKPGCTTFRPIC